MPNILMSEIIGDKKIMFTILLRRLGVFFLVKLNYQRLNERSTFRPVKSAQPLFNPPSFFFYHHSKSCHKFMKIEKKCRDLCRKMAK